MTYQLDALEALRKLPDNYFKLIIIDPPYGNIVKKEWDKKENNPMTMELVNELYRVLHPTGNLYCWCGIGEKSQSLINFFLLFDSSKFYFKDLVTWKKQRGMGMRKGWLQVSEYTLWFVKNNKQFVWNIEKQYSDEKRPFSMKKKGGEMINKSEYKRITNVWTDIMEVGYGSSPKKFKEVRSKLKHATPKPIDAYKRIIKLHTQEGDLVLDCFMGSGTCAVACKELKRNFLGFDIDQDCVEVSNDRVKDVVEMGVIGSEQ